jgi:hypothetical protein
MKCLFERVAGQNERGWKAAQCRRCKRTYFSPHTPDRVHANCKGVPLAWEWGHWLTVWLGLFGITERGLNWWLHRLNIKRGCGCSKRAAKLNTLGSRFNQALAWLTRYNTNKGER